MNPYRLFLALLPLVLISCTGQKNIPVPEPSKDAQIQAAALAATPPTRRKPQKPTPSYVAQLNAHKAYQQSRQIKRKMLEQWSREQLNNHTARRLEQHRKYHQHAQQMRQAMQKRQP